MNHVFLYCSLHRYLIVISIPTIEVREISPITGKHGSYKSGPQYSVSAGARDKKPLLRF